MNASSKVSEWPLISRNFGQRPWRLGVVALEIDILHIISRFIKVTITSVQTHQN
jgi:hypothetical protein